LAIDRYGREIVLDDMVVTPIPPDAPSPICLVLQYAERMVDSVPVAGGGTEPRHIEEGCDVSLMPEPREDGITVARLIREKAVWRVDPAFVPTRLQAPRH
jgi:hypothetical protein